MKVLAAAGKGPYIKMPASIDVQTGAAYPTVRTPPGPRIPALLGMILFGLFRRATVERLSRRYGSVFTLETLIFGPSAVVTDPDLAKQVFLTSSDALGNVTPNLSRLLGSDSVFALDGAEHRQRRNLLTPPFHGKSVDAYEQIIVEETLRDAESWPLGEEFDTLRPMVRITLSAILRALFGAQGAELDTLRRVIPPWVKLASLLVLLPLPSRTYGRFTPWGRLARLRNQYESTLDKLIDDARADPDFESRTDVLSWFLRSRYEDGTTMSRKEIGDELLTLAAAGHETTAATLAWAFERLSRHPELLAELEAEADSEESALRRATIREVQRTRTVVDFCGRHVYAPVFQVGEWVVPRGWWIMISISQIHGNAKAFKDPDLFNPRRYLDGSAPAIASVPYGGGSRRCPGSAFANLEMDVVLRTVLRHFRIYSTTKPGEKWHDRGVVYSPKDGGRIVVRRRG